MKNRTHKFGFLFLLLAFLGTAAKGAPAPAQQANKPLSEQEIMDLVQNYVPTERIEELVHQFGIGFRPSDRYLKGLRKAGADKSLISALRSAKPVVAAQTTKKNKPGEETAASHARDPLSQQQVSTLLANRIPNEAIADLVARYGINFEPTQELMRGWKKSGADQGLLDALQKAKRFPAQPPPAKPEPKEVAKRTSVPAMQEPAPAPQQEAKKVEPPAPAAPAVRKRERFYNVGGEVTPPSALYAPSAPYTEDARRAHVQGTVVLGIIINEHGKVVDMSVLSKPLGHGLEESARRTVATWVFRPANFRGSPVPVRVNVQVKFHQQ